MKKGGNTGESIRPFINKSFPGACLSKDGFFYDGFPLIDLANIEKSYFQGEINYADATRTTAHHL